jgi:hypothetical protein
MIEIELFDGTILQFPADTPQEVIDRVAKQETASRQQAAGPSAAPQATQPQITHTTPDGGRIYQMPDGSRAFASPGYSTTDPAEIDRLMGGATPSELFRSSVSEQILRERPVAARTATALQGVPFVGSYTDELMSAISPEGGANARRAVEAVREERPGQALGLEVAGAVATLPALIAATPAAVPGFVAAAPALGGQALRAGLIGAGAGGAEGLISGFGRGEGEDRVASSIEGGTFGLLGGPISMAVPLAGAGIKSAWQNFQGTPVSEIANRFGISKDAAKAVHYALRNDDFEAASLALQRAGSTSMLADAGPATRQLLDASVTYGGTSSRIAREAVDSRAAESGARMNQVLDDLLGPSEGTDALRRSIREETSLSRDATYRAAYAEPIDYSGRRGRHLENLMQRVPQSAINRANELMRVEGVQSAQILADIADDGSIRFIRMPDVRQLDYITRALGDVASAQNAAGGLLGGTTQLGRATENLSRDIRRTLRNEVPAYATALDTAADAISRTNAVTLGASILNPSTTREMVRNGLRGASTAEREAAKAGFRSALDEKLANVNAVASDPNIEIREFQKLANEFRSRAMRENMESLLGPANANRLYKELDEQVVSLELRAAIARNSATALRTGVKGVVEDITAPNILKTLVSEGPKSGPVNAIKRFMAVLTGTTSEAQAIRQMGIYDEIAGTLVGLRGQQAQQALRLVQKAMAGDALNEGQARTIARALTTPAAMATYATTRPEVEPRQAEPPMAPVNRPAMPARPRPQPPTAPTRGVPALSQPGAGPQGPQGQGGAPTQSREMLQNLFPFDDILGAAGPQ